MNSEIKIKTMLFLNLSEFKSNKISITQNRCQLINHKLKEEIKREKNTIII